MMVIIREQRGGTKRGHSDDCGRGGIVGILLLPAGVIHMKAGHLPVVFSAGHLPAHVGVMDGAHLRLIWGGAGTKKCGDAQKSGGT